MPPTYNFYDAMNALHQLGDTPQARELRNVLLKMQSVIDYLQTQLEQARAKH